MSDDNNALEMSDEDFLNADPADFVEEAEDTDVQEDEDTEPDTEEDEEDESEDEESDDEEDPTGEEDEGEPEGDMGGDNADNSDTDSSDNSADTDVEDTSSTETTDADFAAIGKQIMSEFKANGSTMKMKSAEDAIRLMQMGANYHKKMAGLKPSLKTLKLLENNGLLEQDKLNFLIDLNQRKPEAIAKLLKDGEVDPMDINVDDGADYKPSNRVVNDKEMILDEVLDSISSSAHYDRTLTVLGDEWDTASRGMIAEQPEVIRTINNHMENGIFDQVVEAMNYERSMGKLVGVSDFDAYQQIGAYMNENKLFKSSTVAAPVANQQNNQEPASQANNDSEQAQRKNRKKAASSSRQRQAPKGKKENYNPLAMSDEEFLKLDDLNYG